jgi:hypothetical protein
MSLKQLFVALPALLVLGNGAANAGSTVEDTGALVCVTDKWDKKDSEKGGKVADFAGRCVGIPDDPAQPKYTEDCVAKYEFLPDKTWKASGNCTYNFKGGDTMLSTIEAGSHLKELNYKVTGGTGKYEGASGGGTYAYEKLTDTLSGGRYKGTVVLP